MPSHVYWIEDPWILAVDYSGEVSIADVKSVAHDCLLVMKDQPVYFLIDLSQSTLVTPKALELPTFSEWIYHPNARWFAYVNATGLFKSLIQVRHRDASKHFSTRDEALAFLHKAVDYAIKS
jgi:hypothetical protein